MSRTGVPIEQERRTATVRLDIDCAEQAELGYEIRQLTRELEETPTVIPALSHAALKGIRLSYSKTAAPHAYMAIEMTEAPDTLPAATISITGNTARQTPRSFVFRPLLNYWDVYQPGGQDSPRPISNTSLVSNLADKLPKGTLDSILDYDVPEGFEIARLLYGHLRSSARTRTERLQYRSHGNRAGMDVELDDGRTLDASEFTRDADLIISQQNGRTTQGLFVASTATLDIGTIRKTYGYEVKMSNRGLQSAGGTLYLESPYTIPQTHLEAFARSDIDNNTAATSLYRAIEDIRFTYDLPLHS